MTIESLDIFTQLCLQSTNPDEWDDETLKFLDWDIEDLEIDFYNQLETELFGKSTDKKNDVINILLSEIIKLKLETLSIRYSDDEKEKYKFCILVQKKLKSLFDDFIIIINQICLINNINLENIVFNNYYAKNSVDISIYLDELKHLNPNSFKKNSFEEKSNESKNDIKKSSIPVENLKNYFYKDYYDLFVYLANNFSPNFSNYTKFSCIYRLMIKDKFLSEELKAERFKSLISKPPHEIKDIKFSLNQIDKLSKKVAMEYEKIKNEFFKNI